MFDFKSVSVAFVCVVLHCVKNEVPLQKDIQAMNKTISAIFMAFLAALLYAISIPISKWMLLGVEPVYMAAFLYLGAGVGMSIMQMAKPEKKEQRLSKKELPYTIGMIVLDIAAPISLMFGLKMANSSSVALLNNFEIVITALVAFFIFRERVSKRMWLAIVLITLASGILSFNGMDSFHFSVGSLFVLGACICWGCENNFTAKISSKSASQIVMLKGLFSGACSLIIAVLCKEMFPQWRYVAMLLAIGYISYGLSIFFYVKAQNVLGAAKTSAYYSVNPYAASLLSLVFFNENLTDNYVISLIVMIIGTLLVVVDTMRISHSHLHTHVISYYKNGNKYERIVTHEHSHTHIISSKCHWHKA